MAKNLKELNTRVEELAERFDKGFQELKSSLLVEQKPTDSSIPESAVNCDITKKFKDFEFSMMESLNTIKNEIAISTQKAEENTKNITKLMNLRNSNVLIIHGIVEKPTNVDVYAEILSFLSERLEINITKTEVNRCYRLGQKDIKKCRPVVVEFVNKWRRDDVYYSKKKLKGTRIIITEVLMPHMVKLFKQIRQMLGKAVWTQEGAIFIFQNNKKVEIHSEEEWRNIQDK